MRGSNGADQAIIEARDLKKHFPVARGGVRLVRTLTWLRAVDGVSFTIRPGETFGLVGESGCGKSTTAKLLLLLEKPTAGTILFQGKELQRLDREERRAYRAAVQAVFQDPWSSLNPRMRVSSIIAEPLSVNRVQSGRELKDQVAHLLQEVGLHSYQATLYPHEFSGGQRQRVAIARALALNPQLIVLDEPVSALDVSIRAQIMNLLKDLQRQHQLSYLLIAHNLATVRYMCHRVAVMYLGQIVEEAETEDLFSNPLHPYTKALISAALPSHPDVQQEEIILPGEVPSPINIPPGCRFHPRCPWVMERCSQIEPEFEEKVPGQWVSCHLYEKGSAEMMPGHQTAQQG